MVRQSSLHYDAIHESLTAIKQVVGIFDYRIVRPDDRLQIGIGFFRILSRRWFNVGKDFPPLVLAPVDDLVERLVFLGDVGSHQNTPHSLSGI